MAEYDPFGVIGGGTSTAAPTNYSGGSAKSNAGRTYDPFNINSVTPVANPSKPVTQPKPAVQPKPQTVSQHAVNLIGKILPGAKNLALQTAKGARAIARPVADVGGAIGQEVQNKPVTNGSKFVHDTAQLSSDLSGGTVNQFAKAAVNTPLAVKREIQNKPITDIQQNTFGTTNSADIAKKIGAATAGTAATFVGGGEAAGAKTLIKAGAKVAGKQIGKDAAIGAIGNAASTVNSNPNASAKQVGKSAVVGGLIGGVAPIAAKEAGGVVGKLGNKLADAKGVPAKTTLQAAKQTTLLDKARTSNTKDAELPEDHTKYFNVTSDTKTVPLDKLTSSKTPEENVKGGTNAVGIMQKVSKGEVPKRNPITVSKQADGTYKVLDGNGTLTAAQAHNWQSLPVHVVDESQHTAAQDLNTRATAANDDFHSGAQKVAKAYGLNYKAGPVKGTDRILEKAVNHYGGDVSKVRDSVRGTIPIANPAAADDYVKALSKEFEVTRVKDGYKDPRSGYKDIKVNVKTKDGHEGEIILATPEMLTAKDQQGGHELYNISRDPRRPLAEQQLAEQKGNALYDKAHAATNKRLASGSDLPYSDSKTLSASAGDTSEASLRAPLPKTRETPVKTLVSDTLPSGKERTAKTTSSLVTKNLRESSISSTIADESKNVKDESANGKVEQGTSKVAERIAKDIKGQYGDLAQYDKISIKDQAQKAATLLSDRAKLDKVVSGEDPLPQGLRATSVITAVRSDPVLSKDSELLRQLAGSDLASESSYSAQELRLTRENAKLDPVEAIKGVQKARATALETKTGKSAAKAVSTEVKQIRATVPKVSRQSWGDFIESIKC